MNPDAYLALLDRLHQPPPRRVMPTVLVRGEKPPDDEAFPPPTITTLGERTGCLSDVLLIQATWSAFIYSYGVLSGAPRAAHEWIGAIKDLEQRRTAGVRPGAIGTIAMIAAHCEAEAACKTEDFLRSWWAIVRARFAFRTTQDIELVGLPGSNEERTNKEHRKWRQVVFNGRANEEPACRLARQPYRNPAPTPAAV